MSSPSVDAEEPTEEQVERLVILADQLKAAGNKALQGGDSREAVKLYTQGIEAASAVKDIVAGTLLSQLYSNRAAVNLTLSKFMEVVDDCRRAISADPTNVKAYYRATKASMSLDLFQQACDFSESALKQDSSHAELLASAEECRRRLGSYREAKAAETRGFTQEDALNCQNLLKQLNEQYFLLRQKIQSREFEIARNERTHSMLDEMGKITCYKGMGRGFIKDEKESLVSGLVTANQLSLNELAELRQTLSVLEKRKREAEKEMNEIVIFFNQKK